MGYAVTLYGRPLVTTDVMTHSSRRETAVIAFMLPPWSHSVLPRCFARSSKIRRHFKSRRTSCHDAWLSARRNMPDPWCVIPSSLRLPADSRWPGARPA